VSVRLFFATDVHGSEARVEAFACGNATGARRGVLPRRPRPLSFGTHPVGPRSRGASWSPLGAEGSETTDG